MASDLLTLTEQAVILRGPDGARQPGAKPLLACLLGELRRYGFRRVLLLGASRSAHAADAASCNITGLDVTCIEIGKGSGTAGALHHAGASLEPAFMLLDARGWFDFNWIDLLWHAENGRPVVATLALRRLDHRVRRRQADPVAHTAIDLARHAGTSGLMSGGVSVMRRDALMPHLPRSGSLEHDVVPGLMAKGQATGIAYEGGFVDAALPDAEAAIDARRRRPAVFLDRDGVLNEDLGYVGTVDRFRWCPEAVASIKRLNDAGHLVFVVTNQAGVARGYYPEASVLALHRHMQADLRRQGGHIDDFRYCPFHVEGTVAAYAKPSSWRKPEAGMILDLFATWTIDRDASVLVGDRDSDLQAAAAAGVPGHLVGPEGLTLAWVDRLIAER